MTHSPAQVTDHSCRSFIYRKLTLQGAEFSKINNAAVAYSFGDPQQQLNLAKNMGLADLSPLNRSGFKGKGTLEWLESQGLMLPERPNQATCQSDGCLVARLGHTEILILGDLTGNSDTPGKLNAVWNSEPVPPAIARGFPVPRQDSHAWFAITGKHAVEMFAKICGIDLRPGKFPRGAIAQTSIARLGAIVIRHDLGDTLNFYLLADSSSADYLTDCLLDAMAEFQGGLIGLNTLQSL